MLKNIPIESDNKVVNKLATEALEVLEMEVFSKNECFETVKNGFSTNNVLKARANAEIDFMAVKSQTNSANSKLGIFAKITTHPELYMQLKKWREDTAANIDTDLHLIIPTKSIQDLANHLPTTTSDLKKIKGIGEAKIKQFGKEILEIINNYCIKNKINVYSHFLTRNGEISTLNVRKDTKTISLELFKAGKTIIEIARERGFTVETIEGHLSNFVNSGEINILEIIEEEKLEEILSFYEKNKTNSISEAKNYFGEKYSYGELRIAKNYPEKLKN